ncbi:MAG: M15 family metallopeptidase [Candidatus Kapaibacterium sp.]
MRKIILLLVILVSTNLLGGGLTIVDSKMSFEEATKGTKAPKELLDSIVLLDVVYYSTDKKLHQGQILVHKNVEEDVKYFFQMAMEEKFPIKQVIPIVSYAWSDDASMSANNSSAFNYRFIAGTTRLSNHSFGKAIDINPYFNPVIYKDPSPATLFHFFY